MPWNRRQQEVACGVHGGYTPDESGAARRALRRHEFKMAEDRVLQRKAQGRLQVGERPPHIDDDDNGRRGPNRVAHRISPTRAARLYARDDTTQCKHLPTTGRQRPGRGRCRIRQSRQRGPRDDGKRGHRPNAAAQVASSEEDAERGAAETQPLRAVEALVKM